MGGYSSWEGRFVSIDGLIGWRGGALLTFCVCSDIPSCFLSGEQSMHICVKAKGLTLTANSLAAKGSSPIQVACMVCGRGVVGECSGWRNYHEVTLFTFTNSL